MSMIAGDFKDFLTIRIKPRDDNVSDQYSRIFMFKILLVASMVCGLSWYADKFNCFLDEKMMVSEEFPGFVGSTCWIQGVYVYKQLSHRNDEIAYFGITKDIDQDGMYEGKLCKTIKRPENIRNEHCVPMKKTFFQQYQYMPFLLGAVAFLFYLPYMFHKVANHDLVRLKRETEKEEPDPSLIYRVFFKHTKGKPVDQRPVMYRQVMILMVKVSYLIVNVGAFLIFNGVLNGLFVSYGSKWFKWSSLNNTNQYDYMGGSDFPKPANEILPPFGYCEIWSSAKEQVTTHVNKHKVVCEISQFVLYQYTFVLLWVLIVIGIIVAVLGLIHAVLKLIAGCLGMRKLGHNRETRKIYQRLTSRQMDYFEFLKIQNINIYGEVMHLFTQDITQTSGDSTPSQMNGWDKSPQNDRRKQDEMELNQRAGYVL